MGILIAIVVGGFVGWVASVVMKARGQMGLLSCIVIGIVGSYLGHWLFGVFGLGSRNTFGNVIVAIVGASVLIVILRSLKLIK